MHRDVFTDFAVVMGHDEATDCVMFGVKDINFDWTMNDESVYCGIYMTYFMEQYQGIMNIDPLNQVCL